jgi:hypothetical protein
VSDDAKAKAQAALQAPRRGVYRHATGGLYVLFAVALFAETLLPAVVYYSIERKTRWIRTMVNWDTRFTWERIATIDEVRDALGTADFERQPNEYEGP